MRYARTVLAYHGTSNAIASRLLTGEPFNKSSNKTDWLGPGIYFWEDGPDRALRWARDRHTKNPAVVGAIVQLGNCYDLMDTTFTDDLAKGALAFDELAPRPLPRNRGKARNRDAAVIDWWLTQLVAGGGPNYQTVRRSFEEGDLVHPEMSFTREAHTQIAVRDPACIIGVFAPTRRA
jgi:hypothetical protein